MAIKDFLGVGINAILGGEVIRQIGSSGLSAPFRDTTQTLVGAGVLSNASKLLKFK